MREINDNQSVFDLEITRVMKNIRTPLVANLYNPHEQSQQQLIESFVARQDFFQDLYLTIKAFDPDQPGSIFLIEGQRGMGKILYSCVSIMRLSKMLNFAAGSFRWRLKKKPTMVSVTYSTCGKNICVP